MKRARPVRAPAMAASKPHQGVGARAWQARWAVGLVAAIATGIVFRLMWLQDIEYKADEAWTFTQIQAFWQTHTLRYVGTPSSVGVQNPGLSLWVFLAVSAILPTVDPLELTRAVQQINVLAIVLLAIFAKQAVLRTEREAWLWSVALVSVNPLTVLFSRKLWPPDIFPLFTLGMLVGWWYRRYWWGAFLWGLLGAFLGQIHLSGFFFAAAFFGCIILFDRRSVHWSAWFAGSILGSLPLMPWLFVVIKHPQSVQRPEIQNLLTPFRHWVNLSLGLDLRYSLGADFPSFLGFPTIGVHPTYLAGALLGIILLIFFILLARLIVRLRADPARTIAFLFGARSSTALALNAAFFGYGLLLLLMSQPIYLHYFVVAFSLPALWLAWIAQAGSSGHVGSLANSRRLLAALVLIQAGLTLIFFTYIHETQFIDGDYGIAYGSQTHLPDL